MTRLDEAIRGALSDEDRAFLDEIDNEPAGLFGEVAQSFTGRLGGWSVFVWVMGSVFFALAVFSIWRLTQAETPLGMTLWGLGAAGGMFVTGLTKIWYWMHLNTNALLREVKRLEFQMARLTASQR